MSARSFSARKTARARRPSRIRSFVTVLQVGILLAMGATVGIGLGLFINLSRLLPTVEHVEAPEATIIYSSDGVVLGRVYREDRTNVPLKDIPESLRNATIAIEDSRFYNHSGVDMKGTVRALWANLRGQRISQGGSTITQQLARNIYLTQRKTLERKLQEAVLAILLERRYTKDKILELYLNQIYFGSGAFGVQAASEVYFRKNVDKLDLSESAMLAGLPRRPSEYSPHENLQAALDRRDVVLNRMAELGMITAEERDKAKEERLSIAPRRKGRSTYKAAHFVDYVTRQLRERYGDDVLFAGGLRVYTTLNYEMQKAAEKALREGVRKYESRRVTEGCFVCIEPENGYVRAMVGSVDPKSEFNRCTQGPGRQPGSAFKLFVYAAAMEAGMSPSDTEVDSLRSYPGGSGRIWTPRNYDGRYRGRVTLKTAVAYSINTVAVKVAQKVGIRNVIKYAHLMGIESELEPYLATAIGGVKGVHPIEMASAYGTIANGGIHVPPSSIIRVTNTRGDTMDFLPEGRRVISEKANAKVDELLRAVVTSRGGTGFRAAAIPEARGKTGTTNDDRDAWWIGYVPGKLVAACWVGNDDYSPMRRAYGGLVCAPIWVEFMSKALPIYKKIHAAAQAKNPRRRPADDAERDSRRSPTRGDSDADVVVADEGTDTYHICNDSGLLATEYCPSTRTQTLARDEAPSSYCSLHRPAEDERPPVDQNPQPRDVTLVTVTVCPQSGMLATPYCPRHVDRRVPIDEVPTQVCAIHSRSGSR